MADPAITNTYITEAGVGLREDLSDTIYRIDPDETPFFSNTPKDGASATNHEWQVQELVAVDLTNRQNEGADAAFEAAKPTDRFGNYTQITDKDWIVSGTFDAVDTAGRAKESTYQKMLKGVELRRDWDAILLSDQGKDGADPRGVGTLSTWITNGSVGATTGVIGSGDGVTPPVSGDARDLSTDLIDDAMQQAYESGGRPTGMYVGASQKRNFSQLGTGGATGVAQNQMNQSQATPVTLIGAISIYLTDFGTLQLIIELFMPTDRVYLIDPKYMSISNLPGRSMVSTNLAKTGDASKGIIVNEGTLSPVAPKAHAAVYDLNLTLTP